jgi:RsiW-degrading membrane proteinase PrsW (M82 family)
MPTTLTLGRDPVADIIIGDNSISRRHAELVLLDDRRIFVRDLGGANGTVRIRAGERLVVQREIIAPGDEIAFGDVVLPFDALKQMMLEKLGRAGNADAGAGAAAGAGGAGAIAGGSSYAAGGGGAQQHAPAQAGDSRPDVGVFVPILGGGLTRLRERGLLWPVLAFAIFVSRLSFLFSRVGEDPEALPSFVVEFSVGLVIVGFIIVYRLCGKAKPWMVIGGVMAAEVVIMASHPIFDPPFCSATGAEPIIWKTMHAGQVPQATPKAGAPAGQGGAGQTAPPQGQGADASGATGAGGAGGQTKQVDASTARVTVPAGVVLIPGVPIEMPGFFARFWAFFTCAGLREELEKMLPIFGLIWMAGRSQRTDTKRWGVHEPLDAIVYACAAASMFIVIETFSAHGYVGGPLEDARAKAALAAMVDPSLAAGLQTVAAFKVFPLAVLRTIDALTGHLAYSGYFAFFVGLGLMRPKQRERLWIGGWLSAALIHGFFDAVVGTSVFLGTVAGVVALFFLMTAILNARKISPTRDENFATRAFPRERRAS